MTEDTKIFEKILIYTDGACSGNPGPGAWAFILVTPDGNVLEGGGRDPATTNNRMEMTAVLRALVALAEKFPSTSSPEVVVYTDSTYVIRGLTQWVWAWRQRDWKNAQGEEVLNRDLWEKLFFEIQERKQKTIDKAKIHFRYVRGHRGHPGNERCDQIAVDIVAQRKPSLYQGPLVGYGIAVYDLLPDEPLPDMRPRQEKVAAYSYLSLVNGKLEKHSDWKSCEARVKGVPGAKFKKAMNAEEENSILREWGV